MTTACVFPGQGSQKKGMGAELFSRYPKEVSTADQILGYSIEELCVEDPHDQLGQTDYTQPALFVVNALTYLERLANGAPTADYLAGHSLGEYNALLAASAFDFATGLEVVQRRGALMAEASGGGMAAVVGLEPEKIVEVLHDSGADDVDMANLNSPTQVVLSGPLDSLRALHDPFAAAGCRLFRELDVSAPFHSRYMVAAQNGLREFLATVELSPLSIPVIANATARPYEDQDIADLLVRQVASPVRWTESIQYLFGLGFTDLELEEVGPGRVLTGLVRKIRG